MDIASRNQAAVGGYSAPSSLTATSAIQSSNSITTRPAVAAAGEPLPQPADGGFQPSDRASRYVEELDKQARSLFDLAPLQLPGVADIRQFEQAFSEAMAAAGIESDQAIELTTDHEGRVVVSNDHPDKEGIEALFRDHPEFQQQFVRAQMAQTFQKLEALHQQWQQKIESGMDEEAAGIWLANQARALVDNAQTMTIEPQNKVAEQSTQGGSAPDIMAALYQRVGG